MKYRAGIFLTVLAASFVPLSVPAYNFDDCKGCHEEALAADSTRDYLHSPYRQRQCGDCHAAVLSTPPSQEAIIKDLSLSLKHRTKINWLADSAMADTSHGFLLTGDKAGHTLVVDVRGTDAESSRHEIVVPALAYLPEVTDSGKPPLMSKVRVLKVQRGLFLSATIAWQTDTLTDALVRYDDKDFSQTSEASRRLGRQHQVVLNNLQPDRTYRFTAVSRDLFGHSRFSEPMTFSTSKSLPETKPNDNPGYLPRSRDESAITSSFQRLGTNFLLELKLEKPASVYIGSRGVVRDQRYFHENAEAMGGDKEFHAELSSEIVTSLHACHNCHQTYYTTSHPVNVYPKPGMTIPPEYPTLPDGRITCSSCHASHSSDNEFLTRKRGRRELCIGCHLNMM